MKNVSTLVPDMYELLKGRTGWFNDELSRAISQDIAIRLQSSFNSPRNINTLRLSQMGPKCPKHLWHSIHTPELAVPLPPWTVLKFSYGHVLEALAITIAKAAGHSVVGEQDEVCVDGIVGHRDCIIDGCLFDVKSSSTRGMEKFQNATLWQNDSFGYLEQLDGYICGSLDDPLLKVKDKGYFLAIDLTLGHLCTYEHIFRPDLIRRRITESKRIVGLAKPPLCECVETPDGKSGNLKLDVKASYSPFRYVCKPGLRTFLYANGPVYLTKVVHLPKVVEVDKHGKQCR